MIRALKIEKWLENDFSSLPPFILNLSPILFVMSSTFTAHQQRFAA